MILKGDEFISFFFYKTVTTVILYNILEYIIINLLYLEYEKSNNIIRECEYEIPNHRNF